MVEILLFQLSVQHFITPNGKIIKHCILQNTCGGLAALYCYDKYPRKLNKIKIVFDLQFRFFQTTAVLYYCFLQCRSILTEEDKHQRKSAQFLKTRQKEDRVKALGPRNSYSVHAFSELLPQQEPTSLILTLPQLPLLLIINGLVYRLD